SFLSQRLLGDLYDDFLAFLQQVADGGERRTVLTRFASLAAFGSLRAFAPAFLGRPRIGLRGTLSLLSGRRCRLPVGGRGPVRPLSTIAPASTAPGPARDAMQMLALSLFAQGGGQAGRDASRLGPFGFGSALCRNTRFRLGFGQSFGLGLDGKSFF